MDIAQEQPVIPLGGYSPESADGSTPNLEIKLPLYATALSSLYTTLGVHYLALTSATYPISDKQSRERLVSSFSMVEWSDLSAYLTKVFEHQKHKLRGKPTDADWQAELELLRLAHVRAYRGY
jgi:hypothetical protein